MAKGMRRHLARQARKPDGALETLSDRRDRLAVNSTKQFETRFNLDQRRMWARSRGGYRRRRLPLFGRSLPDRLAVKDPTVEIPERAALFLVRGRGGDRAGAGAGIDSDQDKPRDVGATAACW